MIRVLSGSVSQLRAEYTFALAHLCACPPPAVLQLGVLDFARLVDGIDQYRAEVRAAGR